MVIRVFSVHHRILRKPNHGLITSSPLSNLEFADLASQQAHNALTEDRLALGSRQRFSEPLTAGLKPISSGNAGLSGERRETGFAVKTPWRTPSSRNPRLYRSLRS